MDCLAVIFYKFLRGRVLFLNSAWVYVGSMLGLSWVYLGSILGTLWVIVYQNTNETLTILLLWYLIHYFIKII